MLSVKFQLLKNTSDRHSDTQSGQTYAFYCITRELPGAALVNISTGEIFMGKGNTLNYIDILIALKKLIHLCQKPANDTQF